jgi:hypothetical protein
MSDFNPEEIIKNILVDDEISLCLEYKNKDLDIFQYPSQFTNRTKEEYLESNEKLINMEHAMEILNKSSMLMCNCINNYIHPYIQEHKFKQILQGYTYNSSYEDLKRNYTTTSIEITYELMQKDPEFKTLNDMINHPNFHNTMIVNHNFRVYILNHKYLGFHSKCKKIKEKYYSYI